MKLLGFHSTQGLQEPSVRRRGQEEKQTDKPFSTKSGAPICEDEPDSDMDYER